MSAFNRAYSAPRGYDLRAPYNVPMGEIRKLRVVKPFSIESYQGNTIVEGFGRINRPVYYNFPPADTKRHSRYLQAVQCHSPCTGQQHFCLKLQENEAPWYNDLILEKLYLKVSLTCEKMLQN